MTRLFRKFMKPDPRECAEVRELMSDHLDGELDDDGRARVEDHVGFCQPCRHVLVNLRHTLDRLRHLGEGHTSSEDEQAAERIRSGWRDRR